MTNRTGQTVIKVVNHVALPLVWLSIVLLMLEINTGTKNSFDIKGTHWFLTAERIIASIFIIEYFVRWWEDHYYPDNHQDIGMFPGNAYYPTSFMGIIDLMSWLPFVVGFFVPIPWLGFIRAFRVFRVFKYFRYSRMMQLMALGFYKALEWLKMVWIMMVVISVFNSVLLFELEPNTFNSLFDAFWFSFVSTTTVGYGDISPETVMGKILVMCLVFIPAIAVFSSMIGIITTTIGAVIEAEKDPDIDPIQEFLKERERRAKMKSNRV